MIITTPIIKRQITHEITISANELVGLMKSSRFQFAVPASGAKI
jgi:hypothetical protein